MKSEVKRPEPVEMSSSEKSEPVMKNITLLPGIPDAHTQLNHIDLPDQLMARLRERRA